MARLIQRIWNKLTRKKREEKMIEDITKNLLEQNWLMIHEYYMEGRK